MCKAMIYKNKYAVPGAFEPTPGQLKKMNENYLTSEKLNRFLSGEILDSTDYDKISEIIENETTWNIEQYFYFNDILLIDNSYMRVKINNNYRPVQPEIILSLDYNILLDYITELDSVYYDAPAYLYNQLVPERLQQRYNCLTVEQEALSLLCYQIASEFLENHYTPELTKEDIKQEFKDYRQELQDINQDKLFNLILTAWKEIIKDLNQAIEESLQDDDGEYQRLYINCLENAESYLYQRVNQEGGKILYEEL